MTSQRGDLFDAELAAKELGYVSLPNALRLVCLHAAADSEKFEAAAVRFLGRLIAEPRDTTLGSVQLAAAALAELRTWRRDTAAEALRRLLLLPLEAALDLHPPPPLQEEDASPCGGTEDPPQGRFGGRPPALP